MAVPTSRKSRSRSANQSAAIVIAPSNPLVSVGPIVGVRGVRDVLRRRRDRVVAVTPLVGGRPVKGPLHRMLRGLGLEVVFDRDDPFPLDPYVGRKRRATRAVDDLSVGEDQIQSGLRVSGRSAVVRIRGAG